VGGLGGGKTRSKGGLFPREKANSKEKHVRGSGRGGRGRIPTAGNFRVSLGRVGGGISKSSVGGGDKSGEKRPSQVESAYLFKDRTG